MIRTNDVEHMFSCKDNLVNWDSCGIYLPKINKLLNNANIDDLKKYIIETVAKSPIRGIFVTKSISILCKKILCLLFSAEKVNVIAPHMITSYNSFKATDALIITGITPNDFHETTFKSLLIDRGMKNHKITVLFGDINMMSTYLNNIQSSIGVDDFWMDISHE